MREITYVEAVNEALSEEMERDEKVFLMGEDVGRGYGGGIFTATRGLLDVSVLFQGSGRDHS